MDKPLVTVSIITYNSSKTVLETLDSIYHQSYPRIELIISDDCSSDNTLDLCKQWLLSYSSRFECCRIIESARNTGVTANFNRAIESIKGDYLKLLAADDLLVPDALTEYVNFMVSNPQAIYVFSRVEVFGNKAEAIRLFAETIFDYSFFYLSPTEQFKWLIGNWFQPIPAASCFINVEKAKSQGVFFYDERIPMLEDWPKWIVLAEKGINFCFIEKQLARYRVSDTSICSGQQFRDAFNRSKALLYIYYQYKPTVHLFGIKRAVALYIKNKAIINNRSLWSVLSILTEWIIKMKNKHKDGK